MLSLTLTEYLPDMLCVQGTPKEQPPTKSTKFENHTRRWMFNQAWLKDPKNHGYDVPSRIVESGRLWGDDVDPEQISAKAKLVSSTKKGLKKAKIKKVEENIKEGLLVEQSDKSKGKQKAVESKYAEEGTESSWASYL